MRGIQPGVILSKSCKSCGQEFSRKRGGQELHVQYFDEERPPGFN
jgi:hypothetical protein